MIESRPRRHPFLISWDRSAAAALSPFLVAGLLGLYVKFIQMRRPSGYLIVSRFLGRVGVEDLTALERLSFFREDLILLLVFIPVTAVAALAWLPRGWRGAAAAAAAGTLCALHAVALLMLDNVGQFLSRDMLADAVRWARDDPAIIPQYLQSGFAWKLAGILGIVTGLAWVANGNRVPSLAARLRRPLGTGAVLVLLAAAILSAAGFLARIPAMAHHQSAIAQALAALTAPGESPAATGDPATLLELTRGVARTQAPPPNRRFSGKEQGQNVVFFVFETGPASSLDLVTDARRMPGVGALVEHAFVSRRHYTTYPYTSDALFSILTGLYPLGRRHFLEAADSSPDLGLMNLLRRRGYRCLVYSPVHDTFEADTRMFDLLGATDRVIGSGADTGAASTRARARVTALLQGPPALATSLSGREREALERRLARDFEVLERFKADLESLTRDGQPFVALFLPQIGHGPWVDLYGRPSVLERGRQLMLLQDRWLAEIVSVLGRSRALERTLIVVTADHGLRTRAEYPELPPGEVNDYSFRVPLLVYAPRSVRHTLELEGLTSHIDLVPTVLALLGIPDADRYPSQGLPVWEAGRSGRRLFFFARDYFGSDGYADGPDWVMWQPLAGAVWQGPDLNFGQHGRLVTDGAEAARLAAPIREMYRLQPRLLTSLGRFRSANSRSKVPR